MNAESIKKNRFWFLLPIVILFWLIGWYYISGMSSASGDSWKQANDMKTKLQGITNVKNEKFTKALESHTVEYEAAKSKLSSVAYDRQNDVRREEVKVDGDSKNADGQVPTGKAPRAKRDIRNPLIPWPKSNAAVRDWNIPVGASFYKPWDMDFGEALGNVPYKYSAAYLEQFDDLYKEFTKKTDNIVRFKGKSDDQKAAFLDILKPRTLKETLTDVEVWLLQEEFGLKRDMLNVVAEAVDTVALLTPEWREVTAPEPAKADPKKNPPASGATPNEDPDDAAKKPGDAAKKKGKDADKASTLPPERKRFLNPTWQYGVVANAAAGWSHGIALDLEFAAQGDEVLLQGTATNFSKQKFPKTTVRVAVRIERGSRVSEKAVDLPIDELAPGVKAQSLKAVPAGPGASKILRVLHAKAATALDHRRYDSPDWVVEAQLLPGRGDERKVKFVLYNRSGRRLSPAPFKVGIRDAREELYPVDIVFKAQQKLSAGASISLDQGVERGKPMELSAVRQVFTAATTPVSEIVRLEMGEIAKDPNDPIKTKALAPYNFTKKNPAAATGAPAPGGAPPRQGGPSTPGREKDDGPAPSHGGGTSGEGPSTPGQGIPLNRYIDPGTELRRIPLAFVLVVDQANINDVITAVANSRLRIKPTMTVWHRAAPGDRTVSSAPRSGRGGGGLGERESDPSFPRPGGGGRPPAASTPSVSVEDESGRVELQIYGVATIYEDPEGDDIRKERQQVGQAAGDNTKK